MTAAAATAAYIIVTDTVTVPITVVLALIITNHFCVCVNVCIYCILRVADISYCCTSIRPPSSFPKQERHDTQKKQNLKCKDLRLRLGSFSDKCTSPVCWIILNTLNK